MKFCSAITSTAALMTMMVSGGSVSAFAPSSLSPRSAATTTTTTTSLKQSIDYNPMPPAPPQTYNDPVDNTLMNMFPTDIPMRKMQGGGTVRTWDIPADAERLSYYIRTNGRPLKAQVELFVGPIRRIHNLQIESEDGAQNPIRAMLKFKPGTKTLKISTTGSQEFPLEFGAEVPNANRMKETWAATQKVFDTNPKVTIQGGSTEGGGGSIRYFNIPDDVETTQLVLWSRDVGKRTVKCKIEVLQGPNSVRQLYDLHCGGSTQPYHAIIPTPGTGWTIRIIAVNFMEFPFEAVVEPYETIADFAGGQSLDFSSNGGQMW